MKNLSRVLNADQRYYYYHGSRVYLNKDPEQILITFKDVQEPAQQVRLLESTDASKFIYMDIKEENLIPDRYLLVKLNRVAALDVSSPIDVSDTEIESIGEVFDGEDEVKLALTNQIFFQLKKRYSLEDIKILKSYSGLTKTETIGDNIYLMTLQDQKDTDALDIANDLFESGMFEFAEPNWYRLIKSHQYTPNDPLFFSEWHIPRIQADRAWCWTKGQNISIGIMDVGINTSHPDLQARVLGTYDPTGRPLGTDAHGTPCAGCAMAIGDNGTGVAGVAFEAGLYQLRIGYNPTNDPNNNTFASTDAWITGGMDYAMQNNIDIISASIGIGNPSSTLDSKINTYTTNSRNGKGGVMLASTGNEGSVSTIGYPARHQNVFAVGASNFNDLRAPFSNVGGYVEFLAPGVLIATTSFDGGYMEFSGTSAACPVAAGVAALILSAVPSMTRIQLRDAINFNCDKTNPDAGTKPEDRTMEYGYGRVNANNFFTSYYGIQGSSLFCGTQSQYTVDNLPSGISTSWASSNPNLPINASGLVTNQSGQPGRTVLTANLSNPCTEPRQRIIVAGSFAEEVWATSDATVVDVMRKDWTSGNNPSRTIGIPNGSSFWPADINFGYAPSVNRSTLNPPNEQTLWRDDQGWSRINNGVTAVEVVSMPSTWSLYPGVTLPNGLWILTSGDASGVLEVILTLPCGPINVSFYVVGIPLNSGQ